jgi:PD-(D/E)XK endonuclease
VGARDDNLDIAEECFRARLTGCAFLFMDEKNDNSGEEHANEGIELHAVADDTSKRMGEAVEAAFLAVVCRLRIPVCKPWGDSERYDFVVDWRRGFWRVQVKGGAYCERSKYQAGAGGKGKPFTKEDMDFVVVYIVPEDVWYIVPIEMAEGLVKLWFNPRSKRARFEKYREAWCLLDCPRKARRRGDIPGRCRSEAVTVRCAVCPLRGTAEVKIPRRRG